MKVSLDFSIRVDDVAVPSKTLLAEPEKYREAINANGALEGAVLVELDGERHCGEYFDPLLRLGAQWIRRLPWVLAGDTETVAFRDSEHCFGFVPTGDSVELSFFVGSSAEVEEYVVEPSLVRLDAFVKESLSLCERLVEAVRALSPSLVEEDEECRDLIASLAEAKEAWRTHQLHQRR